MEKITKEMCTNLKYTKWIWPFIYLIIVVILKTIQIYVNSDSVWWLAFFIVTFGALIVIAFFILCKKFNVTKNKDFYIVEDVFINVKEINVVTNRLRSFSQNHHLQFDYQIKFSRNGIHNLLFFSKEEPKDTDADYSAVFFSEPGDKFYLLITKDKEEKRIVKAFNAKYYKLEEDDFDYIEGKYYPK